MLPESERLYAIICAADCRCAHAIGAKSAKAARIEQNLTVIGDIGGSFEVSFALAMSRP
jgi:hypothetical protein